MKSLEELKKKAESDLEKVASKGELTASDWDAAKRGLDVLEKIAKICAYDGYNEDEFEYGGSGRRGHMSYSYGPMMNSVYNPYAQQDWNMRSGNGSYGNNGQGGGSYGYGMRGNGWSGNSYGNDMYGYSGHSVKDRMVARLEGMMDEANSDYEKKQISDWISRIEREEKK